MAVDRRRLAWYVLPVALVYLVTAWAWLDQQHEADDVCAMSRNLIDVATSTDGPTAGQRDTRTADELLAPIDFDLLAEEVPADLRDDVEVVRTGARTLVEGYLARTDPDAQLQVDPEVFTAGAAVIAWATAECG